MATLELDLSEVTEILLAGDSRWLEIESIEQGFFRLKMDGDNGRGGPGKRGLIATTTDGEQIFFTQGQIVGAR